MRLWLHPWHSHGPDRNIAALPAHSQARAVSLALGMAEFRKLGSGVQGVGCELQGTCHVCGLGEQRTQAGRVNWGGREGWMKELPWVPEANPKFPSKYSQKPGWASGKFPFGLAWST